MNKSQSNLFFDLWLISDLFLWQFLSRRKKMVSCLLFLCVSLFPSLKVSNLSGPPKNVSIESPSKFPKIPFSLPLFFYLNERVSRETFRILPSLIMISSAMLLLRRFYPSVILSHLRDRLPNLWRWVDTWCCVWL